MKEWDNNNSLAILKKYLPRAILPLLLLWILIKIYYDAVELAKIEEFPLWLLTLIKTGPLLLLLLLMSYVVIGIYKIIKKESG